MTRQERFHRFIEYFSINQPHASTELEYTDPYQLIVAVILSAQCTDKRVNMITPPFFKRFPHADDLAKGSPEDVFDLIRSCSYPNNKTKHLIGMAKMLVGEYGGKAPGNVRELQKLPGVGRKSANVIASVVFNLPVLAVDTHVFRVAHRLGLTVNAKTPLQAELQLTKNLPERLIPVAHHWLILHGRYICQARRPKCGICGLKDFCKYYASLRRKTGQVMHMHFLAG